VVALSKQFDSKVMPLYAKRSEDIEIARRKGDTILMSQADCGALLQERE